MGTKFYEETADGGLRFKTDRYVGDVRIPNYVYDLWLPLLGAVAVGVYATYCRLERAGILKGKSMRDLAGACRIGTGKLEQINKTLMTCGFIRISKPAGHQRLMHYTTEITVLEPPREVTAAEIEQYKPPRGYVPLSDWLVEKPTVPDPSGVSEEPSKGSVTAPDGASNVASLGLKPLDTPRAESATPADPEGSLADYERIFGEKPKRPPRETRTAAEIMKASRLASLRVRARMAGSGTPWAAWGIESKKVTPRPDVPVLEIRMYGWYLETELGLKPDWHDAKEVVAWTSGLAKLYRMSGGDVAAVVVVGKQMRADGLSVTRPRSLIEMVREHMGKAATRAAATGPAPGGHREWRT